PGGRFHQLNARVVAQAALDALPKATVARNHQHDLCHFTLPRGNIVSNHNIAKLKVGESVCPRAPSTSARMRSGRTFRAERGTSGQFSSVRLSTLYNPGDSSVEDRPLGGRAIPAAPVDGLRDGRM